MKLLLIHQAFATSDEPGGTRHFELARYLVDRGDQVTVITSNVSYLTGQPIAPSGVAEGGRPTEQYGSGLQIVRVATHSGYHRTFVWRVIAFLSFMVSSVIAALKVPDVDVVMGTSPPLFQGVSAWLVSVIRRRPLVFEVRDLWPDFAVDMGVLKNPVLIRMSRWLEGWLYRRATHLIVNSPAYEAHLIRRGALAGNITFIPNGVDVTMFDPDDRGLSIRNQHSLAGKFVVTYAGALGMANDIDAVLDAAQRLLPEPDIRFVLVGDGKERPRLEQVARDRKLSNVLFLGPRPKAQIPVILAASDVCIATLKDIAMFRMTYPNKVFDYMAAGRPTILGIDGVIREVIASAGGGRAVPPGDPAAIAGAVMALKDDPAARAAAGRSAREYVTRHFSRAGQARRFRALLYRLAGKPEPKA